METPTTLTVELAKVLHRDYRRGLSTLNTTLKRGRKRLRSIPDAGLRHEARKELLRLQTCARVLAALGHLIFHVGWARERLARRVEEARELLRRIDDAAGEQA